MGHNDFVLFNQTETVNSSAIIGGEVNPTILGPSYPEFRLRYGEQSPARASSDNEREVIPFHANRSLQRWPFGEILSKIRLKSKLYKHRPEHPRIVGIRRVLLNPSRTLSFNGNDIELQVVGNEARLVSTRGISLAELDAK